MIILKMNIEIPSSYANLRNLFVEHFQFVKRSWVLQSRFMTGSLGNMISILIAPRVMAALKVISTNEKHMLPAFVNDFGDFIDGETNELGRR